MNSKRGILQIILLDLIMKLKKDKKTIVAKKVNQPKSINQNQNKLTWIVGGVIFIILASGAIYFGTKNTENKFGDILSKKPAETTPSVQTRPTIPGTKAHPPEPMETIPPRLSPQPTEVEPSVVPDEDTSGDSYLLPISSSRKITQKDLVGFSNLDLKKVRNEIYARHGRAFVSQDMACYFAAQSWYKENPDYSDKLLSSIEISNATFILNYEKEKQSPYINKDNGCIEN